MILSIGFEADVFRDFHRKGIEILDVGDREGERVKHQARPKDRVSQRRVLGSKIGRNIRIPHTAQDGFIVFHFFARVRAAVAPSFHVGLPWLPVVMLGPRFRGFRSYFTFSGELRRGKQLQGLPNSKFALLWASPEAVLRLATE